MNGTTTVTVTFVQPDGAAETVRAAAGTSLRDAALEAMIDGIEGMCGGSMSCATCHVYLDDDWYDKVSPISAAERDVLEQAIDVRPNSRLACQLRITPEHEGLVVTVPEEQP